MQYHWRSLFSRPSSGWDRVFQKRYYHQVIERQNTEVYDMTCTFLRLIIVPCGITAAHGFSSQSSD